MPIGLRELLAEAGVSVPADVADVPITSVTYDSRTAGPGSLFVAVAGFHVDGHAYVADAVARGASAVVTEHQVEATVPAITVANSREVLSWTAAALEGYPSRELTVAGITGTDGKTTTTTMLWAAWQAAGMKAASSTTVEYRIGDVITPNESRQTTLEAVELQHQLRQIADARCECAAIETSSHSLALHRVDSIDYRIAVYTRVTSEHLDIHGTREEYLAAKMRLAELASRRSDAIVVLDMDDDFATPTLRDVHAANSITYSAGGHPEADLRARAIHADSGGVSYVADTPWGEAELALRVAGRFNVANSLAALAAACSSGADLEAAVRGITGLERVSGRMERVVLGQPFSVVIDYAHTADALEKVLTELRGATEGRLWVVFGSAGERDREKRPAMGAVAARLADHAVITDEDPRQEDRHQILNEIAAGAVANGGRMDESIHVIADRVEAIEYAVSSAQPGDTILLAGKGHETCILIGGGKVPYSERDVAEAAVLRRMH